MRPLPHKPHSFTANQATSGPPVSGRGSGGTGWGRGQAADLEVAGARGTLRAWRGDHPSVNEIQARQARPSCNPDPRMLRHQHLLWSCSCCCCCYTEDADVIASLIHDTDDLSSGLWKNKMCPFLIFPPIMTKIQKLDFFKKRVNTMTVLNCREFILCFGIRVVILSVSNTFLTNYMLTGFITRWAIYSMWQDCGHGSPSGLHMDHRPWPVHHNTNWEHQYDCRSYFITSRIIYDKDQNNHHVIFQTSKSKEKKSFLFHPGLLCYY